MLQPTPHIYIPADELQIRQVRAGGPGGQNVNKVATAIVLRFDAAHSPSLPAAVRRRLLALAGSRGTKQGEIVLHASRFRTAEANRKDALARLSDMILQATKVKRPRRPTKPSQGAKKRRMASKQQRGDTKRLRGRVSSDD